MRDICWQLPGERPEPLPSAVRQGSLPTSKSHLAVFSVAIPSSPARLAAAEAEGARPFTLPGPCSASQAVRSAPRAADFQYRRRPRPNRPPAPK